MEKADPGDPIPSIDYKEHLIDRLKVLQNDIDSTAFSHSMEIEKESIVFIRTIGHGAFGLVRKAILKPDCRVIAVKTLKGIFFFW